jgi:hypothetical protein
MVFIDVGVGGKGPIVTFFNSFKNLGNLKLWKPVDSDRTPRSPSPVHSYASEYVEYLLLKL